MNNKSLPAFNPDIVDYISQMGWKKIDSPLFKSVLVFVRDGNKAIMLFDNVIEYKISALGGREKPTHIIWNWQSVSCFQGYDRQNMFQLMWLLDFMGAIKLADVNRAIRSEIINSELTKTLSSMEQFATQSA